MIIKQVIRKIIRAIKRDWRNKVQTKTFAQKVQAQAIQNEIEESIRMHETFQKLKTDNVSNKKLLICRPSIKAYSFYRETERTTVGGRKLSELDIMEISLDIEHVWKLLRFISNLNDSRKCEEIWGCKDVLGIINNLSPYKLIEKLELYRSNIKRGCVVQHELDDVCGTVLSREGRMYEVFTENGDIEEWDYKHITLTGKTVDIQKILKQIGGKDDEENTRED